VKGAEDKVKGAEDKVKGAEDKVKGCHRIALEGVGYGRVIGGVRLSGGGALRMQAGDR